MNIRVCVPTRLRCWRDGTLIVRYTHTQSLAQLGLEMHLFVSFKHFMYFVMEHRLIEKRVRVAALPLVWLARCF